MTLATIFSNEYCQYITTGVYSGIGDELEEKDLPVIQRAIAEWCGKDGLMADALIEEGEIVVRVGHFSEDAGPALQMSIFQDIGRPVGRIINKGFIFSIKGTVKNPFLASSARSE